MLRNRVSLLIAVVFAGLLCDASSASAQIAPSLGSAQSFAVLSGSTVTNTGASTITGDLGVSPGAAVTGFPPGLVVSGTIHAADAVALAAQNSVTTAYNSLASQACTQDLTCSRGRRPLSAPTSSAYERRTSTGVTRSLRSRWRSPPVFRRCLRRTSSCSSWGSRGWDTFGCGSGLERNDSRWRLVDEVPSSAICRCADDRLGPRHMSVTRARESDVSLES